MNRRGASLFRIWRCGRTLRFPLRDSVCYVFMLLLLLNIFVQYDITPYNSSFTEENKGTSLSDDGLVMTNGKEPTQLSNYPSRSGVSDNGNLYGNLPSDIRSNGGTLHNANGLPAQSDGKPVPYLDEDPTLPRKPKYFINCTNIHQVTIKRKLGHGFSKQVYLGIYNGKKYAVKMVTRNQIDVTTCIKRFNNGDPIVANRKQCYAFPNMKIMKEILLLEQLDHPNIIKMIGYCVRSEESESTSLQEHGVVSVHEYGLNFYSSQLAEWPWKLRLKTLIELADLLDYLENSPLGSVAIADFKAIHFLQKDGRIKLIDFDDMSSAESPCTHSDEPNKLIPQNKTSSTLERRCSFNLKCIGGICPGQNAKRNLYNMNKVFFTYLLQDDSPHPEQIPIIRDRLDTLSVTAGELKQMLYSLNEVPILTGYA